MTEQYKCQSYTDDNHIVQDCTCGKCITPDKRVEDYMIERGATEAEAILMWKIEAGGNFEENLQDLRNHVTQYHQDLMSEVEEKERRKIKLRIDYDRRKGIPAEETVADIYDSIELKAQTIIKSLSK